MTYLKHFSQPLSHYICIEKEVTQKMLTTNHCKVVKYIQTIIYITYFICTFSVKDHLNNVSITICHVNDVI